jgi:nucleoside-diphosphate-sugar epimerase
MSPVFTVLGSGGFLGSALVSFLRGAGVACLTPERGAWDPPEGGWGHVIYAVGLTADFRTRPFETVEAHVGALARFLEQGRFSGLTYLSSTRVYQYGKDTREEALLSTDVHQPGDLYNLSKLLGESLCLHAGIPGVRVVRLSNVVGPRKDRDLFMEMVLHQALSTGKVRLLSSLESAKDYISLQDAVNLIYRIATSGRQTLYNVASGENISHATLCGFLEKKWGTATEVAETARDGSFPPIAIDRIRSEFGFTPQSFECYFGDYVDKFQQQFR